MKRIKIGSIVVLLVVAVYFVISYGIFLTKKPIFDDQLTFAQETKVELEKEPNNVILQRLVEAEDLNQDQVDLDNESSQVIITQKENPSLPTISAEIARDFFLNSSEKQVPFDLRASDAYSFVTMPADVCTIDQEIQMTLDVLIGNDLDAFVKLVLQSNNSILSKEACRSCAIYAFFSAIKNHKKLNTNDIRILQALLINLYQFVENMKSLSNNCMMRQDQYLALQELNRSQVVKNNIKLQARKAATSAALKKLQAINYNN